MEKKLKGMDTLMSEELPYYMNLNNFNMRTFGWRIVIFLLAVVLSASCKEADNLLFVAKRNGLYGYVNTKGDTIVDCNLTDRKSVV